MKARSAGLKHYELTDHLGNVNVAVLDKISGTGTGNAGEYAYLSANISSFNDYYPFGMPMPERNGSASDYRFGFNGQEKDNEIKGDGNQVDFKFRAYDTRLGRFMAVDPLTASYPYYTPYQFAGNTPIWAIDLEGAEPGIILGSKKQVQAVNSQNAVIMETDKNWTVFDFINIRDAVMIIKAHKVNNKVFAIYLTTHGYSGGFTPFAGADNVVETEGVNLQVGIPENDDESISGYQLLSYNKEMEIIDNMTVEKSRKRALKAFYASSFVIVNKVNELLELTNLIEDGGTLIIGGCNVALGSDGELFMKEMSKLVKHRIKIIANQDYSLDVQSYDKGARTEFLDFPLKNNINKTHKGWNETINGVNNPTNSFLKLNSKGEKLYEFEGSIKVD